MLTWNDVLKYIKNRLALPSSFLEKSDDEIKEYLISNALTEYSNVFPDVNRVGIKTSDVNIKHPKLKNCYLIKDEDNLDIFGIKECYFPQEDLAYLGHPIIGVSSMSQLKNWSLQVFNSRFLLPFSLVSYIYKFIPPNVIEISGELTPDYFVVEYERMHPSDLSKISPAAQQKFKDFCLAHTMIYIGTIRSLYSGLHTPFGEIPINGSEILSKGEDMREKLLDEFREESKPQVIIETY